jgi:hypothetical protein
MKTSIFMFFIGLGLLGCAKKYDGSIASGQVVDATTGKPIPFAKLYFLPSTGNSFIRDSIGADHYKADTNGRFQIRYYITDGYSDYYLFAKKQGYFDSPVRDAGFFDGDHALNMTPKGYMRLQFLRSSPTDSVIFQMTVNDETVTHKVHRDTTIIQVVNGNSTSNPSGIVYKKGAGVVFKDSYFVKANDTAAYTVAF